MGWLVVSDVDHTLLETPAETVLAGACVRQLRRRGIETLLASSKTFTEMVALQQLAGLAPQPFLFENGAGIGWPLDRWPAGAEAAACRQGAYGAIVAGREPQQLVCLLGDLRRRLGLRFALLAELRPWRSCGENWPSTGWRPCREGVCCMSRPRAARDRRWTRCAPGWTRSGWGHSCSCSPAATARMTDLSWRVPPSHWCSTRRTSRRCS